MKLKTTWTTITVMMKLKQNQPSTVPTRICQITTKMSITIKKKKSYYVFHPSRISCRISVRNKSQKTQKNQKNKKIKKNIKNIKFKKKLKNDKIRKKFSKNQNHKSKVRNDFFLVILLAILFSWKQPPKIPEVRFQIVDNWTETNSSGQYTVNTNIFFDKSLDSDPNTCLHFRNQKICRTSLGFHPSSKIMNRNIRMTNGNIMKSLIVTHWNGGSKHMKNQIPEIQYILDTRKPDLLLLSEANIFDTNMDHELVTIGYTMQKTKTWDTVGHCRLIALVRNGLQLQVVEKWMSGEISSIWYKISSRGCRTLYLGGVYREHSVLHQTEITDSEAQQITRWKIFINQWTTANRLGDCIIIGDTNLDHLKWANPDPVNTVMTNLVKDGPETEGAIQMIAGATRFWPHQNPSLIDQIWANCPQRILTAKNIQYSSTDHNIIEVTIKLKGKIGAPKVIRKRCNKNWNSETYKSMVEEIDWTSMYNSTNVSQTYGIFEENLRKILDKIAPMKTVQLRNNYKPWIDDDLKILMNTRDSQRKIAINTGLPSDWNNYKAARNKCNFQLRKSKDEHIKSMYKKLEIESNISDMYKLTRQQLGWSKTSTPDSFLVDGRRISSPSQMANIQAKSFNEKIRKLVENLPAAGGDPLKLLKTAFLRWGNRANQRPEFKLNKITSSQTEELLRKLGNSNSSGNDQLDSRSLKIAATSLILPITFIINQSIETETFPNQWKVAQLIPLHKGKGVCPFNPSNYRAIAILPVLSKLAE